MEKYDRQNLIIINSTILVGLVDLSCVVCSILSVYWNKAGWLFAYLVFALLISFGWWLHLRVLRTDEKDAVKTTA